MALLHLSDREIRAPETEVLPDGRKRLTRFLTIPNKLAIPPELNFAYGSADKFANAPTGWAGLLLTNKKLTDDLPPPGRSESRPVLVLVYEQIDVSAETTVGADDISYDESGFKIVNADFIQFTTGTYTPGTVGTTTYGPDAACVLKEVAEDDDGAVRHIKRTYINGGTLSDETQTKNNGSLLLRTIKTVKTAPSTPAGFTLIGNPIQNPNGMPVYTYTFAKGNGEISRTLHSSQLGGNTLGIVAPISVTAGGLVEIVTYLTASSVTVDPTTSNLLAGIRFAVDHSDQDGFRIWTVSFGQGAGVVEPVTETRNGGKLKIYRKVGLGTAPAAPAPTIGGTVVQIVDKSSNADGFVIYDYSWAEGVGEISRGNEYRLSNDGGTTGMTVTTVKYLSATSVGSNPITPPGGFATVQDSHEDVDGYRIWTGIYANGTGVVITATETKNNGKLVVYTKVALNTAPTAPAPTIGGTVVAIRTENKRDRFHEGIVVYDYMWAEGVGTIVNNVETHHNGKLIIYHKTALAVAPTAPGATIGGTVVLFEDDSREESGVTVYDRKWAEGKGVVHKSTQAHDGGLRSETWVSVGTSYDASFMLPAGILMLKDNDELDGATRWAVTCMQRSDGSDPIGSLGKVTAIAVTNSGNSYTSDPTVTITAPPAGGTQATAHAVRSGNTVASVVIDNPGAGYTSAPTIGFTGGGGNSAAATATIDGAPTVPLQYEAWVPFRYPGQAKLYNETVAGGGLGTVTVVDLFLSPPIEVLVKATHVITYQASATVGSLANTLWNPTQYATLRAKFANTNGPRSIVRGLEGYSSGAGSTSTGTDGGGGTISLLGERLYASSSFSASISGGPTMPDGATTYSLHAEVQPAFIGYDGTQYYRRIVITALPAALPALPV